MVKGTTGNFYVDLKRCLKWIFGKRKEKTRFGRFLSWINKEFKR